MNPKLNQRVPPHHPLDLPLKPLPSENLKNAREYHHLYDAAKIVLWTSGLSFCSPGQQKSTPQRQRDIEFAERDLEFVQRDLEFAQRDLEFAQRDLEFPSRDLELQPP